MKMEYKQPERFALMLYKCLACEYVESVWNSRNSRNAVTPFAIGCGDEGCDGQMQHINWQHDRPYSTLPRPARRVFVSITRKDAERLAKEKLARFIALGHDPITPGSPEEVQAKWTEQIYGNGDNPLVILRSEYLRRRSEKKGCGRRFAAGPWWSFCGETDMGQTDPALCVDCGGEFKPEENEDE